jgi:hypothetical protein
MCAFGKLKKACKTKKSWWVGFKKYLLFWEILGSKTSAAMSYVF